MDQSNFVLLKNYKGQRQFLILEALASLNKVFNSQNGHLDILTAIRDVTRKRFQT